LVHAAVVGRLVLASTRVVRVDGVRAGVEADGDRPVATVGDLDAGGVVGLGVVHRGADGEGAHGVGAVEHPALLLELAAVGLRLPVARTDVDRAGGVGRVDGPAVAAAHVAGQVSFVRGGAD